jgi:O-antigen/teichoic acid export membrane protein
MNRLLKWFLTHRASTRVAFVLQIVCRVLFSLCSLLWTPLLLSSMGRSLNGLFLNFQRMASLGVIGDLGMGGLINIRTSRLLGQGKEAELRAFLAATRSVYLVIGGVVAAGFLLLSPGLFRSLRFAGEPGVGSLNLLSAVGGAAIVMVVFNSYIANLNFGCGNVVWPVVPTFVLAQAAVLTHWLLALRHAPLWLQYTPYVATALLVQLLGWVFVRLSHPALAVVGPLRFQGDELVDLGVKSFWVYLYTIGFGIYSATDGFLISAGFGPAWVPLYQYNYKLCELAFYVVFSAGQASLPKLTQWIASSDPSVRARGIQESLRLNKFQTSLGCCAVYVYLNCNDWFVGLWLGKDFHVPLSWQAAFAITLGVNAAGLMGSDLLSRCCERGIRLGGVSGLVASLVNFVLAFAAMKAHSIFGIALALATVMSAQNLLFGWYSCRELQLSWWRLSVRNWLLALLFVGLGLLARIVGMQAGRWGILWAVMAGPLVVLLACWLSGIRLEDLRQEKKVFGALIAGLTGSKNNPERTE